MLLQKYNPSLLLITSMETFVTFLMYFTIENPDLKLIHELKKDINIRKLVLYGSSLEFRCSSYSDIDIYIEKYDSEKKLAFLPELDCEVDIITNLQPDNRLYQRIEQTGLLLFER